jgi:threonine dehydratase
MTVTIDDIEAAQNRIEAWAIRTPLLESPALAGRLGAAAAYLKPEVLQRGGAFKFRGAMSRISKMTPEELPRGVVAFSSGNHAQGVALAAAIAGTDATIVMPTDAPRIKIDATRAAGAAIRLYDRQKEDREAIAREIASARGSIVIPAYDDADVIAGQGTIGLEIAAQAVEQGGPLDVVLGPVGGGGLIAGVSTALAARAPSTRVYGVEPAGFDSMGRSLAAGERVGNQPGAATICDSLIPPMPGVLTFAINGETLAGTLAVTDEEVKAAIRYAFETLKLVVEPGGSVGLAALLAGKLDVAGKRVGIILSGGNVDPGLYGVILNEGAA